MASQDTVVGFIGLGTMGSALSAHLLAAGWRVTGYDIDVVALQEAIRLSEEKYCSVGAMVQKSATFHTTFEILEDKTEWLKPPVAAGVQG